MSKRVLLGMSGGVDSSVSALLLKQQGYEVVGATMCLWEEESQGAVNKGAEQISGNATQGKIKNGINNLETNAINDAKAVCEQLGIEHHVIDFRKMFKEKVVDNFINSYMCGKTPNPCVECNKFMKFGAFAKLADDLRCEYIATGHYAKVEFSKEYNQYVLKKSEAQGKDQTYFLYGIDKKILPRIIFPLSNFNSKEEIRKIASDNGLKVAEKKDSQEICFISDNDYVQFLKKQVELGSGKKDGIIKKSTYKTDIENANSNFSTANLYKQGNIIYKDGSVLGKHSGLINYTIGQRKGLGIAYKDPLYVVKLDTRKNEVIVGTEKDLYSNELIANELNFLINIDFNKKIDIKAKIRYRAKDAVAKLEILENKENVRNNINSVAKESELKGIDSKNMIAKITFIEPQRAITPGQSIVFYLGDVVLGGGKIL